MTDTNRYLHAIDQLANEIDSMLHTTAPIKPMDYAEITQAFIALANSVEFYPVPENGDTSELWYLGEHNTAPLADLITGAYWHYTEWHAGQDSLSYAALSALGQVYTPNMATLDEDNYAEKATYDELATMAENA